MRGSVITLAGSNQPVGAARSVNTTHVVANWLIGREIVEEEQKGTRLLFRCNVDRSYYVEALRAENF